MESSINQFLLDSSSQTNRSINTDLLEQPTYAHVLQVANIYNQRAKLNTMWRKSFREKNVTKLHFVLLHGVGRYVYRRNERIPDILKIIQP